MYIVCGGVAQLGERLTGSQKVMGSSPTVSTIKKQSTTSTFGNVVLKPFGVGNTGRFFRVFPVTWIYETLY